jgi:hypothetical protein
MKAPANFLRITKPTWSATIAPGTYWIGDPCYAFTSDDEAWQEVLGSCEHFRKPVGSVIVRDEPEPHLVAAFPTWHGDGEYEDTEGYRYSVDSGLIGIMRIETAVRFGAPTALLAQGRVVEFVKEQTIEWEAGRFIFGTIEIDTVPHSDDSDA